MNKILVGFFSISVCIFGISYEELKKHALGHAKILQSKKLSNSITKEQNSMVLRTKNPVLSLEVSRFDSRRQEYAYGYSANISQKIYTDSYYDALSAQTDAQAELVLADIYQSRADFLKNLENLYTDYVYQNRLLLLLKEEYNLSKKVSDIAKERYKNGTETKVAILMSKTETTRLKAKIYAVKKKRDVLYYKLINISSLSKKTPLEKKFIYTSSKGICNKYKQKRIKHPKERIFQAQKKLLESKLHMSQSNIDSYQIYTGVEKEPEQSILRAGVSFALPLLHNKSQERTLAKLQLQQFKLDYAQLKQDISSEKQIIATSINQLLNQYHTLKILKEDQNSLLALLQDSYSLSKESVFELMRAKNRLIQTRKSLLQIQRDINKQKILYRYLQGDYND